MKAAIRDLIPRILATKIPFSDEVPEGLVPTPESDATDDVSEKPNSPRQPNLDESTNSAEEFIEDDVSKIDEENLNCSMTIQQ